MACEQLVSFWDGPVSWVERLCVASMLRHGHPVAIYTYDPEALAKFNLGAEIRDARQIAPEPSSSNASGPGGRFALFSNWFRLRLQKEKKGIWVDLDCYMLRPLTIDSDYIFAFSSHRKINGAVLRLPAECPMVDDYISAIAADPMRMPWASFRRRLQREAEILLGRSQPHPSVQTNIGPRALTYFIKKHRLLGHALPQNVFYPIAHKDTYLLIDPEDNVLPKLNSETIMLHVWNSRLGRVRALDKTPPPTSYLGKACKDFGIESSR